VISLVRAGTRILYSMDEASIVATCNFFDEISIKLEFDMIKIKYLVPYIVVTLK
jgi:hypothetical protein